MIVQKGEAGYVIIGAMIAIAVFSIGILSFWGLHITAMANNKLGHRVREATSIANEYVTKLKIMDYDDISIGIRKFSVGPSDNKTGYYLVQENISDAIDKNIKQLTVQVGWRRRGILPLNINDCDWKVDIVNFISNTEGS